MKGLMQNAPLMISSLLQTGADVFGGSEVVSVVAGEGVVRHTYRDINQRAKQLAQALGDAGIGMTDRVATLAWNDHRHLEIYYGVSGIGAVCHTINPRLFPEQLIYIINHAEDRIIMVDPMFVPLIEKIIDNCPKLEKIVLNMGVSGAVTDRKVLTQAMDEMTLIAGQKPVETIARKSEAGFKIRDGMKIGCKVTLRGTRMYEFLDRLITIAMPRIRDFRGLNGKGFDGRGNYAMGLKEHIVFPEIDYDKVDEIRGMDIVICTTATTDAEAKSLLTQFNMPFNS